MKKGEWKSRAGKGIAELETQEGFRNGWESGAWGGEARGFLEDELWSFGGLHNQNIYWLFCV